MNDFTGKLISDDKGFKALSNAIKTLYVNKTEANYIEIDEQIAEINKVLFLPSSDIIEQEIDYTIENMRLLLKVSDIFMLRKMGITQVSEKLFKKIAPQNLNKVKEVLAHLDTKNLKVKDRKDAKANFYEDLLREVDEELQKIILEYAESSYYNKAKEIEDSEKSYIEDEENSYLENKIEAIFNIEMMRKYGIDYDGVRTILKTYDIDDIYTPEESNFTRK